MLCTWLPIFNEPVGLALWRALYVNLYALSKNVPLFKSSILTFYLKHLRVDVFSHWHISKSYFRWYLSKSVYKRSPLCRQGKTYERHKKNLKSKLYILIGFWMVDFLERFSFILSVSRMVQFLGRSFFTKTFTSPYGQCLPNGSVFRTVNVYHMVQFPVPSMFTVRFYFSTVNVSLHSRSSLQYTPPFE